MINIRKSPPIIHAPDLLIPVSSSRPTALAARIRNNVGNANNIMGVPNTQTQLINLNTVESLPLLITYINIIIKIPIGYKSIYTHVLKTCIHFMLGNLVN